MKLFVANTDPAWYHFLAHHELTAEVNFWRPRGRYANFRAISTGELFFLRLRRPYKQDRWLRRLHSPLRAPPPNGVGDFWNG